MTQGEHGHIVFAFICSGEVKMSLDFILRIFGMFLFGLLGGYLGVDLSEITTITAETGAVILGLVGALFGLVLTPFLTTRPLRSLRSMLSRMETRALSSGLLGLTVGLVIAALLSFPLSLLPSPFGEIMPFIGVLLFAYLGVAIFVMRKNDIYSLFSGRVFSFSEKSEENAAEKNRVILVDTSVIIDGRIADISKTGFLVGELLIPRFVLDELQYIADSADGLRRQRGRRGMEILSELQEANAVPVRISDIDVEGTREVDSKLVILARQLSCPILTNDYNLNRVAELQGVPVLNINELANAVKAVLLPGETVEVTIIQEGKERGQGVGYLSDGTMVVVEEGKDYMDKEVNAIVTKVLQTAAGRMIFARPEDM